MSQKSIFCVSSSGLYNYPYSIGHASYWSLTPSDRNLTLFIDQCLWQFIEVMASCIPNCFSKVSPQIFNGIEMRTLWWPFQTTHVLVRFPLLDNVSSVAWGTIILENKVISISQKMCWRNGRVPENIQIAILVKVAFQWSEKPSSSVQHCTPHSHNAATKFHCGYNTTVSVCFMGSSPHKHPTIILKESESWLITPKHNWPINQVQSSCAIANRNLFLRCTAVIKGFFKATCATRPASSRLRTVLFDAWMPTCIHPILKCGTVSLLFCCDCLTSSLSSLCVRHPLASWSSSIFVGPCHLVSLNCFSYRLSVK